MEAQKIQKIAVKNFKFEQFPRLNNFLKEIPLTSIIERGNNYRTPKEK